MIPLPSNMTETLTRRRVLGGRNAEGEVVEGPPVDVSIQAVVVPLGLDRLMEEGGLRAEERWQVFTREHLQAVATGSRGDELYIRGKWHRVVRVEHHTSGARRLDHYEAETILST